MTHINAEYMLTFEEFAEAYRALRRRKKFLSGRPERSPLVGCAWLAGLFVLVLIALVVAIYWTGHSVIGPTGRSQIESNSPIVQALISLLGLIIAAGLFWFLVSRTPVERRLAGRGVVLLLLFGACSSIVTALTESPTPANPPPVDNGHVLLQLLPWLVGLGGTAFLLLDIARRSVRLAWEGQPHLRDPFELAASNEQLILGTRLMRTEYDWIAFVARIETDNLFVLFVSALGFHAIPKRGFTTTADVDAFRELLSLKVPADAPQPRGFDVNVAAPA